MTVTVIDKHFIFRFYNAIRYPVKNRDNGKWEPTSGNTSSQRRERSFGDGDDDNRVRAGVEVRDGLSVR